MCYFRQLSLLTIREEHRALDQDSQVNVVKISLAKHLKLSNSFISGVGIVDARIRIELLSIYSFMFVDR